MQMLLRAFLFAAFASTLAFAFAQSVPDAPDFVQPPVIAQGESEKRAQAFVDQIRPKGWTGTARGIPRWNSKICTSVIGPPAAQGQIIADHIARQALALGLKSGKPGCDTNILVIATDDPAKVLLKLVEKNRALFGFTGDSNIDTDGSISLSEFIKGTAPARWRQVIEISGADGLPLDADSRVNPLKKYALDKMPLNRTEATRLRSTTRRELSRVVIAADAKQTAGRQLGAVADHLALVALAEVDASAEVSEPTSILNLFGAAGAKLTSLSSWDRAFLCALYETKPDLTSSKMQNRDIAQSMVDGHCARAGQ
jgi:hypothetical protein